MTDSPWVCCFMVGKGLQLSAPKGKVSICIPFEENRLSLWEQISSAKSSHDWNPFGQTRISPPECCVLVFFRFSEHVTKVFKSRSKWHHAVWMAAMVFHDKEFHQLTQAKGKGATTGKLQAQVSRLPTVTRESPEGSPSRSRQGRSNNPGKETCPKQFRRSAIMMCFLSPRSPRPALCLMLRPLR
ncbi:Fibrous Sheath-Interacting Protein 1 [Manis pentadactyla]|nr:Fibrous Sheath-Interacting Protein 1 [Manis pentadactyla]